jgi:threonine synthase
LLKRGFFVEPTSAVAVAALDQLTHLSGKRVLVILTGSGLKSLA